ncbi:hypothetical protein D6821_02600 [Candidatus Parcubacteria bacterium]|nr:MAG: hypothetical protein D6821_02600 [Candidatus Parcubacteria bacterium]
MKEFLSHQPNKESLSKNLADVAIGAGLVVAGPEIAQSAFQELSQAAGTEISFMPEGEALQAAMEVGIDTAQGLTGIVAMGMIAYLGAKKMLSAFDKKH